MLGAPKPVHGVLPHVPNRATVWTAVRKRDTEAAIGRQEDGSPIRLALQHERLNLPQADPKFRGRLNAWSASLHAMRTRRFKIGLVVAILAAFCVTAYVVFTRPTGDAGRYAQMHKFGASYKRAWSGRPSFPERVTALIHFSNPSNYFLARFKEQQRALVASGYMVQVSV